jgi:hypothetical protein
MITPHFFNKVQPITLTDPLSNLLGNANKGIIEYSYGDVVKLAGHSCPTVAGAYLMLREGLNALYGQQMPIRGEIKVFMRGALGEGTVGVVANIASMITGATDTSGFHGLNGHFDRRNLLYYEADIEGEMALERVDTRKCVVLRYNPSSVFTDQQMDLLMMKVMGGIASEEEKVDFATLWQNRVERILFHNKNEATLVTVSHIKG